jgi:CheY-like chemotaxis protein
LDISTAVTELNNLELDNHVFGVRGHYAVIIVTDSGVGIPKEIKNKIFDPFFTTKDVGMGTGLGLSIAYGIVKSHSGYIDVVSEQGIGTTFKIYLPLAKRGLPKRKAPSKLLMTHPPMGAKVLLVEDDSLLREVTADTLRRGGYEVLEASNGEEAIARLETNVDVHLVLCDVVMPKKNGREVYEWTRTKKRNVHFLFTTGYSADIFRDGIFPEDTFTLVSKPYTSELLLTKMREILTVAGGETSGA